MFIFLEKVMEWNDFLMNKIPLIHEQVCKSKNHSVEGSLKHVEPIYNEHIYTHRIVKARQSQFSCVFFFFLFIFCSKFKFTQYFTINWWMACFISGVCMQNCSLKIVFIMIFRCKTGIICIKKIPIGTIYGSLIKKILDITLTLHSECLNAHINIFRPLLCKKDKYQNIKH